MQSTAAAFCRRTSALVIDQGRVRSSKIIALAVSSIIIAFASALASLLPEDFLIAQKFFLLVFRYHLEFFHIIAIHFATLS